MLRQAALDLKKREDESAEPDPVVTKIGMWPASSPHLLAPALALALTTHPSRPRLGKYDATVNKEVAKRYGVSAYPTVLYFKREPDTGEQLQGRYEGARTKDALMAFVARMTLPHLTVINSLVEVEDHHYNGHVAFLLTVPLALKADEEGAPAPALALYKACARNLQAHAAFLLYYSESGSGGKAITLQKLEKGDAHGEGLFMRIPAHGGETDVSASTYAMMALFIHNNNRPLVSVFDNHNFKVLGSLKRVMAIATCNSGGVTQATAHASMVEAAKQLTEEQRDRFVFGVLDAHRWRAFLREHTDGLHVPRALLLDLERDLFLAGSGDPAQLLLSHLGGEQLKPIPKKSFLRRLRDKLAYYYPWSVLFVVVPAALLALSLYLGLDEQDRRRRTERKRR